MAIEPDPSYPDVDPPFVDVEPDPSYVDVDPSFIDPPAAAPMPVATDLQPPVAAPLVDVEPPYEPAPVAMQYEPAPVAMSAEPAPVSIAVELQPPVLVPDDDPQAAERETQELEQLFWEDSDCLADLKPRFRLRGRRSKKR